MMEPKKDWDWLVACRIAGQVDRLPPGAPPLLKVIGGTEPCKYCDWIEQIAEDGSREGYDGGAIATILTLWPGSSIQMTQPIPQKKRDQSATGRLLVFTPTEGRRILLAPKRRMRDVGKPEVPIPNWTKLVEGHGKTDVSCRHGSRWMWWSDNTLNRGGSWMQVVLAPSCNCSNPPRPFKKTEADSE